ncbi:MAG: YtxH domain-containing protein [Candidatus Shapirobacteria bacterium]|nr:YtxH domain-containing protein [Candidatus Shapirobacteria bacterium]
MNDNHGDGGNFFRGLVAGAVFGGVLVWFLNQTEKGQQIKKEIKEKSSDALENLGDLVQDLEEKGEEFKKKVVQVKEEFEEKAKDFRQEVAEEAKIGLSKIEELEDQSHKAAQKFFTRRGKPLV